MTVRSNLHLHTDDRVRRTSCRQHVLLSAVTMTITVLENYQLCGGTSAVQLSSDFLSYSGGEERLSNIRFGRTSSRKQPLLNRQHPFDSRLRVNILMHERTEHERKTELYGY